MPLGKPVQSYTAPSAHNSPGDKATDFELSEPKYSLGDIILDTETRSEINALISHKRDHTLVFERMGFSSTHKYSKRFVVNFYGEPGTGKTIAAHAIAKEFRKKILLIDYSQIESKYVGDTPKNLKRVFDFAKLESCVIFFDEADAILSKRVTSMQSSTDTSVNQTRSVMLNILNEFDGDIIFATNFISNYDSAFMRRISKHVKFNLPDYAIRKELFEKYIPGCMSDNIDIDELAGISAGLSAADIENSTLMAAFSAASESRLSVTTHDINKQISLIKESKRQNASNHTNLASRHVPEDYVEQQLRI
ncbi:ATP-binding protein [Trinickia violacea]|uniref:ATP-binding protein n=1 Tax=Trinickia violacea TaxID=2571746 RepID=A0A4P8IJP9_9BURK|nr:ATP-binding protein [Trinickia violacea]QCP47887.1 ATP-binding protein [Trinickia violacea]